MNVWVSTSIIKARGIIAQSRVELLPQGDLDPLTWKSVI
jgi:hypothetical protein